MAVIREHLAAKGLGLFNDLQNEHSMVGNFPDVIMLMNFGSEKQKAELIPARLRGEFRMTFGLTEPGHGSDATHMATKGVPEKRAGVDAKWTQKVADWYAPCHALLDLCENEREGRTGPGDKLFYCTKGYARIEGRIV
jgi:alkylation response protein AidB-like acyl-CoA dehydrogenase